MVVIDATILLLMLRPGTPVPAGPDGAPVDRPKERIEYLVQQLDKAKTKIVIPTPALSEALVRAGPAASQGIVEHLQMYRVFRIENFDARASIEVAAMAWKALDGGKKKGDSNATWAKVKYDRQIVGIAKVCGATTIYSDDDDIAALVKGSNIEVVKLVDLPLPPEKRQIEMALQKAGEEMALQKAGEEEESDEGEEGPETSAE